MSIKKADETKMIRELCRAVLAGKKPQMSDAQKRILARYQFVVDTVKKVRQGRPDLQPFEIRSYVKGQLATNYNISLFQAGIDFVNTMDFFDLGTTISQKELNINIALQENSDLIERAIAAGDLAVAAMFERNKVNLLKLQSDRPVIDWYAIPFPTIRFAFNPKMLKGDYKQSLKELYEEIQQVELKLNIDSNNHKDQSILNMFDISDVDFNDIEDEK